MEIQDLIKKLFGEHPVKQTTLVDNWWIYEVPRGAVTTMRLETLFQEYAIFGINNLGQQLIMAKDYNVLISYPKLGDKEGKINVALREDNLRPCFLNDMSDEDSFEQNRIAPKLRYGYVWRSQVDKEQVDDVIPAWKEALLEIESRVHFKGYEADNKSWHFIESTMLNKQDLIPQLRNCFKPGIKVETDDGILYNFTGGFVAIDKYRNFTIAIDYDLAYGRLEVIQMATAGDRDQIDLLLDVLSSPVYEHEEAYMAFKNNDLETALLSAIGNSI